MGAERAEDATSQAVHWRARTSTGTARFLTDRAEHERAMAAIRRKYWMFRPIIELGRFLAAIGLMRDKTGSFEVLLAG